jgi:hypothetical protein
MIDVRANEDYDTERAKEPDGFVFYRCYLDILHNADSNWSEYVSVVGNLLERLWSHGCRAVAACDFEGDLPRRGGYFRG